MPKNEVVELSELVLSWEKFFHKEQHVKTLLALNREANERKEKVSTLTAATAIKEWEEINVSQGDREYKEHGIAVEDEHKGYKLTASLQLSKNGENRWDK